MRLHSGLVFQNVDKKSDPDRVDLSPGTSLAISDPDLYGQLRAAYDVNANLSLTSTLRHVGEIDSMSLPSYTELDLNISWYPRPLFEVAVSGDNLLNNSHSEIGLPRRETN